MAIKGTIHIQPRQSGKTSKIAEIAKEDDSCLVFCLNQEMYRRFITHDVPSNQIVVVRSLPREQSNPIVEFDHDNPFRLRDGINVLVDEYLYFTAEQKRTLFEWLVYHNRRIKRVEAYTTSDVLYNEDDIKFARVVNDISLHPHQRGNIISEYLMNTKEVERGYNFKEFVEYNLMAYPKFEIDNARQDWYREMGHRRFMIEGAGLHLK